MFVFCLFILFYFIGGEKVTHTISVYHLKKKKKKVNKKQHTHTQLVPKL